MANMNMTQMMWDDFLRIDIGMFGSTVEEKTIDDEQKLFYSAAAFNPTFPDHPNSAGAWDGYPSASQINNPHMLLDKKNHNTGTHISTYTKFTFQLLPELKFTAFGAYTYDSNERMRYIPTTLTEGERPADRTREAKRCCSTASSASTRNGTSMPSKLLSLRRYRTTNDGDSA